MKDDKKKEDAERYSRSFDRDTPITESADSTEPASEVRSSLNGITRRITSRVQKPVCHACIVLTRSAERSRPLLSCSRYESRADKSA